jgi:hypothetical protein
MTCTVRKCMQYLLSINRCKKNLAKCWKSLKRNNPWHLSHGPAGFLACIGLQIHHIRCSCCYIRSDHEVFTRQSSSGTGVASLLPTIERILKPGKKSIEISRTRDRRWTVRKSELVEPFVRGVCQFSLASSSSRQLTLCLGRVLLDDVNPSYPYVSTCRSASLLITCIIVSYPANWKHTQV